MKYTNRDVKDRVSKIIRDISVSGWQPDYIVGLTRGGLVPAAMLSYYYNLPMHALNVSFRDSEVGPETNLWMPEDAIGGTFTAQKQILIVDDINDSGQTLQWIKEDWESTVYQPDPLSWKDVWHKNVRFAVLVDNTESTFDVDYSGGRVNKTEDPSWIIFPWERWWH